MVGIAVYRKSVPGVFKEDCYRSLFKSY